MLLRPIQKALSTSLLTGLVLSSLACQERTQLKEMRDNTQEMNKTSTAMAGNIERTVVTMDAMKATSDEISATAKESNGKLDKALIHGEQTLTLIAESYDTARQGGAMDLRNKIYDIIKQAKTPLDEKIVQAAKYFVAFEFQLWSGLGQDTETANKNSRDKLSLDAVTELFNILRTVAHWDEDDLDPFARPNEISIDNYAEDNQKAIFNSLAATLHKANRKQDRADTAKAESITMFSLIADSLLAGQQIKAGAKRAEDYPEYVNEVLKNEPLAIRLLQARYNMLGLIFITRVSKISDSGWVGFKMRTLGNEWDFDLEKWNASQLHFFTSHFTEAEKTHDLLKKLGISILLDSSLKKMFSKMKVSAPTKAKTVDLLQKDKQELLTAIKKYTSKI